MPSSEKSDAYQSYWPKCPSRYAKHVVHDPVLEVGHPVPDLEATTAGIDHTRTSPAIRAIRIAGLTRTSRSAISVPRIIVRPTLAIVKTMVRLSVSQKTWSRRTELKLSRPIHLPECADQLEERVLLQRDLYEAVDRISERGHDRGHDGEDEQVGDRAAPQAAATRTRRRRAGRPDSAAIDGLPGSRSLTPRRILT